MEHVYTLPNASAADAIRGDLALYHQKQDSNYQRIQLFKNGLRVAPGEQRMLHHGLFTNAKFYQSLNTLANAQTVPYHEITATMNDLIPAALQAQRTTCAYPEFLSKLIVYHKLMHEVEYVPMSTSDIPDALKERVANTNMRCMDAVEELIRELRPHRPIVSVLDLHALGIVPSMYTYCESQGFHMIWELNQAPTRTGEAIDPYSLQQVYPASALPEMSALFTRYGHADMINYVPLNPNVDNCGECANCIAEVPADDLHHSTCLKPQRFKINVTGYANTEISPADIVSIQYTLDKSQSDPKTIIKITRELEHNEGLHNLIALALNKLNLGGTCIFHLHGTFLLSTLALLAFMSSIFRAVRICKPMSMRADSPVCIVVCVDRLTKEHQNIPTSPDPRVMWYKGAISQSFLDDLARITQLVLIKLPNEYLKETVDLIRCAKNQSPAAVAAACAPRNEQNIQKFGRLFYRGMSFPPSTHTLTGVTPIAYLARH
jgi:hypothetical protein